MRYIKKRLVKYSNKLLPIWEEGHWEVKIDDKHFINFSKFENAVIYDKLIKIEKMIGEMEKPK